MQSGTSYVRRGTWDKELSASSTALLNAKGEFTSGLGFGSKELKKKTESPHNSSAAFALGAALPMSWMS